MTLGTRISGSTDNSRRRVDRPGGMRRRFSDLARRRIGFGGGAVDRIGGRGGRNNHDRRELRRQPDAGDDRDVGQSVTFVNTDSRSHDMESDPHPAHTACPSIATWDCCSRASRKPRSVSRTAAAAAFTITTTLITPACRDASWFSRQRRAAQLGCDCHCGRGS